MKQYCRYCSYCSYGDVCYCDAKKKTMSEEAAKNKKHGKTAETAQDDEEMDVDMDLAEE